MSNDSSSGLEVSPIARWFAIVPVLLIAGGAIAFGFGFRLEGRAPYTVTWRTQTAAEDTFTVATPGMFIINQQPMNFQGQDATAQVYMANNLAVDFSVTAVRRPDSDTRPSDEVAKSLGLAGNDAAQTPDGVTAFTHDVTLEGTRTQARLIFRDRMMYQVMVTSPAASFPEADAARFFSSFRLLDKSAVTKPRLQP